MWIDEAADFRDPFPVTLPDVYAWESQAWQYRDAEPPEQEGITYYPGEVEGSGTVDCLLYWKPTTSGKLRVVGILNHYPFDSVLERKGNVNIWVRRPNQRQGIATALLQVAEAMFGPINPGQQRYTAQGAALARHLTSQRPAEPGGSGSKG